MSQAILFDSTKCVGCRACEGACAERWNLAYDDRIAAEEKLSARKLTTIRTVGERYVRRMCMHCNEPTCVSVCPVGAFQKTKAGPVVYDESRCIGCRYCMQACPFQVPAYEWSSRLPRIKKCDFCADRQAKGQPPACVEACPVQAAISGDRDALIAEARERLRRSPGEYHPKIYGVDEAGGTSVLMLSAVPFEQLGLKAFGPEPLPALTWRALALVPDVATVGSVLLGGIYWITHRREKVAAEEGRPS